MRNNALSTEDLVKANNRYGPLDTYCFGVVVEGLIVDAYSSVRVKTRAHYFGPEMLHPKDGSRGVLVVNKCYESVGLRQKEREMVVKLLISTIFGARMDREMEVIYQEWRKTESGGQF